MSPDPVPQRIIWTNQNIRKLLRAPSLSPGPVPQRTIWASYKFVVILMMRRLSPYPVHQRKIWASQKVAMILMTRRLGSYPVHQRKMWTSHNFEKSLRWLRLGPVPQRILLAIQKTTKIQEEGLKKKCKSMPSTNKNKAKGEEEKVQLIQNLIQHHATSRGICKGIKQKFEEALRGAFVRGKRMPS